MTNHPNRKVRCRLASWLLRGGHVAQLDAPLVNFVAARLRLPASNHSAERIATVDRFYVPATIWLNLHRDTEQIVRCARVAQSPLNECWIEIEDIDGTPVGAYLRAGTATIFMSLGPKPGAEPLVTFDLAEIRRTAAFAGRGMAYKLHHSCADLVNSETSNHLRGLLVSALAAINIPGAATVRRLVRHPTSAADRALVSRRLRSGSPMFSFNVVEQIVPPHPVTAGIRRQTRSHQGRREHKRRGHWRLCGDDIGAAYWTWIEGQTVCKGSPLGAVIKERLLSCRQTSRRGFVIPDVTGIRGQRMPAAQTH